MLHAVTNDNKVYKGQKVCMHHLLAKCLLRSFLLDTWQQGVWIGFSAVQKIAPVADTDFAK